MSGCAGCGRGALVAVLDVGAQPIASHFLPDRAAVAPTHRLAVGICERCGLLQQLEPPAPQTLVPPYDWITVNEPELHLDNLADTITALAGGPGAVAAGATFKDDSLLRRLAERGFRTWRIAPDADLGEPDARASLPAVQERLDEDTAAALAARHGPASVVVARQILEHMADPRRFVAALARLVRPDGLLVLEVPDCARSLESLDYTTLWEEHTLYFTEPTYHRFLADNDVELVHAERFPYPVEDSLVAVVRPSRAVPTEPDAASVSYERERAERFAGKLPDRLHAWQSFLADRSARAPVALFGAGHLSCMFLCLMGVGDRVAFVADDNPHKQGLLMPGSYVPIRGSQALLDEGVGLCLLGVGPESEDAIVRKNAAFVERGGTIASLLPASTRALTP